MQWFESKKAILEYCGKDGKDVRWLERAIKDGKVWVCEWDYYLVSEYVKDLEKENWELEEENSNLHKMIKELEWEEKKEEKSGWVTMQEVEDCAIDLREHLIYARKRLDHVNSCIDWMVQNYFNKNRQSMDFDSAQAKLYSIIKYVPDPNEKEERQFAIDNWLDLE